MNDLLIALTAWQIGATVITANIGEFGLIADHLPGLVIVDPGDDSLTSSRRGPPAPLYSTSLLVNGLW